MIGKLMLGTVQFGLDYGIANKGGQVTYAEVLKILEYAYASGIRYLDTAAAYGNSETVLGNALAELGLDGKFKIVTKISPVPDDADAGQFINDCLQKSLEKLRLERVYGCLFHREDDMRYQSHLEDAKGRGLIENCGVSVDSTKTQSVSESFDIVQMPFNILDTRFEMLFGKRFKIHARSAYLQGLLLTEVPEKLREIISFKNRFEKIRQELGVPGKEFYLRYNLSRPEIDRVLIGVDSLEQLKENIDIARHGVFDHETMWKIAQERTPLPEYLIRPTLWKSL